MFLTLSEVIEFLEKVPSNAIALVGLGRPHLFYDSPKVLAFEPEANITAKQCLENALLALGSTYTTRKGEEVKVSKDMPCYVARDRVRNEAQVINYLLLQYMFDYWTGKTSITINHKDE